MWNLTWWKNKCDEEEWNNYDYDLFTINSNFRQSTVSNVCPLSFVQKNILRFEISVDNSFVVEELHSFRCVGLFCFLILMLKKKKKNWNRNLKQSNGKSQKKQNSHQCPMQVEFFVLLSVFGLCLLLSLHLSSFLFSWARKPSTSDFLQRNIPIIWQCGDDRIQVMPVNKRRE